MTVKATEKGVICFKYIILKTIATENEKIVAFSLLKATTIL